MIIDFLSLGGSGSDESDVDTEPGLTLKRKVRRARTTFNSDQVITIKLLKLLFFLYAY